MTLLEEQNKIWNPSSLAPLQLLSWSFCIHQAASLRSLMSIELLEERGLCRGGLWSPCPSVHEHAAPLTLGSGWCQPSGAVTWAAACSSPAWLVFTLGKSTSPAAARGFGMSPELRVAKCCVCLQWELKSLSYPTQLVNITVFHYFLHTAVPGPLPHWGWHLQALAGAGAKELQICMSFFTAFWHIAYFVCM